MPSATISYRVEYKTIWKFPNAAFPEERRLHVNSALNCQILHNQKNQNKKISSEMLHREWFKSSTKLRKKKRDFFVSEAADERE